MTRKLFRITIILLISVLIIALFRVYRKYYDYPNGSEDYYLYRSGRPDRSLALLFFRDKHTAPEPLLIPAFPRRVPG